MIMLLGCALLIGFGMSTPAGRKAARVALARRVNKFWPVPVALWLLILEPWRWVS